MTNLIKTIGFNPKQLPEPQKSKVLMNEGVFSISEENENLKSSIHLVDNKTVVVFNKTKFDNKEKNHFFFLFDKKINNIENLKKEDLMSLLQKNEISEAVVVSNRGNSFHDKSLLEFNYTNNSTKSDTLMSLIVNKINHDNLDFPKEVQGRVSRLKI